MKCTTFLKGLFFLSQPGLAGVILIDFFYHLQVVSWRYFPRQCREATGTIQRWKVSGASVTKLQGGLLIMRKVCVYVVYSCL